MMKTEKFQIPSQFISISCMLLDYKVSETNKLVQ